MTKTCPDCKATVHSTSQPAAAECDWPPPFELMKLQARGPETGNWIDIYPAQLEQMLKQGLDIRVIEPPAALAATPRCDRCGSSGDVFMMCAGCQSPLAAAPADEEARDNLRLIDYIADKIGLPETDELSQENFDAWMLRSATPAVGGEPVAWRWRWKGKLENNPWRLVFDASGISHITAETQPLYLSSADEA